MNLTPVIAIFDIGKTNKKLFLFDEGYRIVHEQSRQFEETTDEDGYPCEDIHALTAWVKNSIYEISSGKQFELKAVNFSTYGASFVHTDQEGKPLAPLYNYLKPLAAAVQERFYARYGNEEKFSLETASPPLGNLNSGLQIYRLKQEQPQLFKSIKYCLHLPQYMSFLVTRRRYSDITSIGCHTGLWNFPGNYYHEWVHREQVSEKLAPIFPSNQGMPAQLEGKSVVCGVGLHDSSAALIPYLSAFRDPFILISTGTWCITLNPFNQTRLTAEELKQDCLCYMEYRGRPVKASRIFAGYEHEQQVKKMASHFNVSAEFYKSLKPDTNLDSVFLSALSSVDHSRLSLNISGEPVMGQTALEEFPDYESAYFDFMMKLVIKQFLSTNLVLKQSAVKKIYVDGGFGSNAVYMHLLSLAYPQMEVFAASIPQASAMGAAMAIHTSWNKNGIPKELITLKPFSASAAVT
jgi:L-fuculokinase